jgi:hypothetical protein
MPPPRAPNSIVCRPADNPMEVVVEMHIGDVLASWVYCNKDELVETAIGLLQASQTLRPSKRLPCGDVGEIGP